MKCSARTHACGKGPPHSTVASQSLHAMAMVLLTLAFLRAALSRALLSARSPALGAPGPAVYDSYAALLSGGGP